MNDSPLPVSTSTEVALAAAIDVFESLHIDCGTPEENEKCMTDMKSILCHHFQPLLAKVEGERDTSEKQSRHFCLRVLTGENSDECPFCLTKQSTPGVPNPMCHLCDMESEKETLLAECANLRRAYNECWAGSPVVKAEIDTLRVDLAEKEADSTELARLKINLGKARIGIRQLQSNAASDELACESLSAVLDILYVAESSALSARTSTEGETKHG